MLDGVSQARLNNSLLAMLQVDPEGSKKFTPTSVYPEMVGTNPGSKMPEAFMKDVTWAHLRDQVRPRCITTHMFGEDLPKGLIGKDGTGRLIVVLRNLKVRELVCICSFFS